MGTMVDVIVGVTGDVITPALLNVIGTAGDERLRLNGRLIEVPVATVECPCLSPLDSCDSSLWLSCVSTGVSSGGRGLELDVGAGGKETEAGDVIKLSGRGRVDEDKLLGRIEAEPPDDIEPVFDEY